MSKDDVVDAVIGMVPNWYRAPYGPRRFDIYHNTGTTSFCCHRNLTPGLGHLRDQINATLPNLLALPVAYNPGFADIAQEHFATTWLTYHDKKVPWKKVLRHLLRLSKRTYENSPVALNLIISDGTGTHDVSTQQYQKFFDQLAGSPFSYLRVDRQMNLFSYNEIKWSEIQESEEYKFHPEFLHPFQGMLDSGDFSVHLTSQGDVIIMDHHGLLASKRKGHWKVYDVNTLKNTITQCLGNYYVGCNMFEISFDLSYKRHGALLVYDPDHSVLKHVANKDSIVMRGGSTPGSPQHVIADSVSDIALGESVKAVRKKRLLEELASIDGAVLFDNNCLLAVGAIVDDHPDAGNHLGARTTAAVSAYKWGGSPIKVSSDGEVTIYFKSSDGSNSCDAAMEFL